MEYESQLGLIIERGTQIGISVSAILVHYHQCLQRYRSSHPHSTISQQSYNAEWATWVSLFWPEDPFPGSNPQTKKRKLQNISISANHPIHVHSVKTSVGMAHHQEEGGEPETASRSHSHISQQQNQEVVCGSCRVKGHFLVDCTKNVDEFGFIPGCPFCNTTSHNLDECPRMVGNKVSQHRLYHFLVKRRRGKPPIRTRLDFRLIDKARFATLAIHPQTCQFASFRAQLQMPQEPDEQILDPIWSWPPELVEIPSQRYSTNEHRGKLRRIDHTPKKSRTQGLDMRHDTTSSENSTPTLTESLENPLVLEEELPKVTQLDMKNQIKCILTDIPSPDRAWLHQQRVLAPSVSPSKQMKSQSQLSGIENVPPNAGFSPRNRADIEDDWLYIS